MAPSSPHSLGKRSPHTQVTGGMFSLANDLSELSAKDTYTVQINITAKNKNDFHILNIVLPYLVDIKTKLYIYTRKFVFHEQSVVLGFFIQRFQEG